MWPILRLFVGKSPSDVTVTCPSCAHSDTLRNFGTWEDGE